MSRTVTALLAMLLVAQIPPLSGQAPIGDRPRARDVGVEIGSLRPGPLNAITDVDGVRVGHTTLIEGDSVRTGVTAILPHAGNAFRDRVPAAIYTANGFGKLLGSTQVDELGELETPVLLTCTLCVWGAADALVEWLLARPGMEDVRSINPVVGETNDGGLNDIRSRPIRPRHVVQALEEASAGPVEEGSVGAGTGTRALGFKGGIGTSSRRVGDEEDGHTVGVLVQSNFGGSLTIDGVPVGRELRPRARPGPFPDGSVMIVVATDAPLSDRNLRRLALRAVAGLARTGSSMSNGSGDYVLAFSTAGSVRRDGIPDPGDRAPNRGRAPELRNSEMTPLFAAVAEATEEAIVNSLFKATTVTSAFGSSEALPIGETLEILRRHDAVR